VYTTPSNEMRVEGTDGETATPPFDYHRSRVLILGRGPRQMQTLVQVWKQFWKWLENLCSFPNIDCPFLDTIIGSVLQHYLPFPSQSRGCL